MLQKKAVLLATNLFLTLSQFKKDMDAINALILDSVKTSDLAIAFDGVTAMISAANSIVSSFDLDFRYDNYIGTIVPLFYLKEFAIRRGYGKLATSLRVDGASNMFSELLKDTITNANLYTRIKKLADAIYKTRVRYNAIDKKLLPSLAEQEKGIVESLDAMALNENFITRMFSD